ncbi:MAG: D-alanyl-D-alanine carboxypeptidase family protein [Candidatus Metalachnospira sp.]|nr:D-alanyl-D-alanine carboxypeptidase family protein [Candidatus Metalachnospira sp.]
MNLLKKILIPIMAVFMVFQTPLSVCADEIKAPDVKALGAVLIDAESGRVLWEKNANEPLANASTTKIMTCALALESGMLDDKVTVSANASSQPKVRMGLSSGEEIKLKDLLYALMLQSSNDAAVAVAEHIGGSVEAFCEMMNKKSAELGAANTNFETPNGLDGENHYSTAYDMALITRYALGVEGFRDIIGTKQISVQSNRCTYTIVNKNRLLSEYEGAIGVKTGFTGKAGNCFVGAAERDGMTLISVVLGSGWGSVGKNRKWIDTKNILNYGFQNYMYYDVCIQGDYVDTIPVKNSYGGSIRVCIADNISLPLRQSEREALYAEVKLPDKVEAPVKEGDEVGRILFKIDSDTVIAQSPLISCSAVNRKDVKTTAKMLIKYWINPMKSGILKNNG